LLSSQAVELPHTGNGRAERTCGEWDDTISIQTLRDPSLKVSKSLGTEMFLETYLIKKGLLIKKVVGAIDWTSPEMKAEITAALDR
jgi:hypothetical protein